MPALIGLAGLEERVADPLTADWGPCIYYFETDDSGEVIRQLEVYENGSRLKYDDINPTDDYGFLSDQPLNLAEFAPFSISEEQFEDEWEVDTEEE